MFDYYNLNLSKVYPHNYDWELSSFCKSEKVNLEYLIYSRKNSKK